MHAGDRRTGTTLHRRGAWDDCRLLLFLLIITCLSGRPAGATGGDPAIRVAWKVQEADPAGFVLAPPRLPDLSAYTAEAVDAMIDSAVSATISLERMGRNHPELEDFTALKGLRIRQWIKRQHSYPRAIFIRRGYATLEQVARAVGPDLCARPEPGVFLLKIPLVVAQGATLHLDSSVRELRLSQEGGAFIVNSGLLFCLHTRVVGWSEQAGATARFHDQHTFRPFITAFGGSQTYFVDSTFVSLGYHQSKSYGIVISQYSMADAARRFAPPTGWLIGCTFTDIYYGFYCYEAEDVVIINNTYRDNIVYGIDPHDRSRRLIIAGNMVSGSHKKHGIIISREVNDSWIFNNRCHHNHRSGIVLDRNCQRTVVAGNTVDHNGGDGITVYECAHDLFWGNLALANQDQGIRFRNSTDLKLYNNLAISNGRYGIFGHLADLAGTGRNLALDPYTMALSFTLLGGRLADNGRGPISFATPVYGALGQVEMLMPRSSDGIQFTGGLLQYEERVLDILSRGRMVVIRGSSGSGPVVDPTR